MQILQKISINHSFVSNFSNHHMYIFKEEKSDIIKCNKPPQGVFVTINEPQLRSKTPIHKNVLLGYWHRGTMMCAFHTTYKGAN